MMRKEKKKQRRNKKHAGFWGDQERNHRITDRKENKETLELQCRASQGQWGKQTYEREKTEGNIESENVNQSSACT